jgi:hypothetical protein
MGRRKSNRKPPPKRKAIEPLETMFNWYCFPFLYP